MPKVLEIASISTALEIYYSKPHIGCKDIQRLFGCNLSNSTICKLKAKAREKMADNQQPIYNSRLVNTKCAFMAWGIDVDEMEKNYKKLRQLGLLKEDD